MDDSLNKVQSSIQQKSTFTTKDIERPEIDVIRGQKWSIIIGIPQLACYNPEIDWKMGEIKMTRCLEGCRRKWRQKQGKSEWQKQKKKRGKREDRKEARGKDREKTEKTKNDKSKEDS